jgi:hypothetical protein
MILPLRSVSTKLRAAESNNERSSGGLTAAFFTLLCRREDKLVFFQFNSRFVFFIGDRPRRVFSWFGIRASSAQHRAGPMPRNAKIRATEGSARALYVRFGAHRGQEGT